MINWYKEEEHRIRILEQMRTYHHKKKQALSKDFKITSAKISSATIR